MEEKIKHILQQLDGISCSEAIFILGSVQAEVEQQQRDKLKEVIFKI
jgi:hypothetical protein